MIDPRPSTLQDAAKAQAWQQHYSKAPTVASYRGGDRLQAPEAAILAMLAREIVNARVLDVGVGAGRTSVHLAGSCKNYTAIDYAATMVAACRERFMQEIWFTPNTFLQGDVRALPFHDAAFDLVLFSFNGLDYVSRSERQLALAQCRRVLHAGGSFIYSSHNLNWLDGRGRLPRRGGWRDWLGDVRYRRQMLRLNAARMPSGSLDECDLLEPPDGLSVSYARPCEQLRQARAAGFTRLRVFDCAGREVTHDSDLDALRDPWLYFMGRAENS